jgi:hypothetical protein
MPFSEPKAEDLAASSSYRTPAPEDRYAQWYQRQANKLPSWAPTSLGPQTPAELAVTGMTPVADALAAGALAIPGAEPAAPFIKYGLPLATAAGVGAWEAPPGQRLSRAWEETKKTGEGQLIAKPIEYLASLPARVSETGLLRKSASRIMGGVKDLFNEYPKELGTPNSMAGIERDVTSGKLEDAVGNRLGEFKKELAGDPLTGKKGKIPEYRPGGAPAQLTMGAPYQHPSGEPFTVFTPDASGEMIPKKVSIGDAIDHLKKMNGLGYGGGGSESGGAPAAFARDAGHKSRDSIYRTLDRIGGQYGVPLAGEQFKNHSADYGTAVIMQDALTNARRSLAHGPESLTVIDQPKLDTRIEKEMSHLRTLQPERVDAFRAKVAPGYGTPRGGGRAILAGGGRWGLRRFTPESRWMYGPFTQLGMNAPHIFAPVLGRKIPVGPLAGLALQNAAKHLEGLPGLRELPEGMVGGGG